LSDAGYAGDKPHLARNKIVDTVVDAVVGAELAIVRTGRQAVQAVNRRIGAGKRKVATRKKAAKKAARKVARKVARKTARTKRTVGKVARKVAPKAAKKAVRKAAKRARRR
jgi:hypothetical protein